MMTNIYPAKIISKYYSNNPIAWKILLDHSRMVTQRALKIARYLHSQSESVDLKFVAEASMLHDIGMIRTNTPELDCHGTGSYLQHGIRGREILEREGLFKHARVCERHIGVGLTAEEIRQQQLPLPARDMQPETLEEQIISYADLFYSKNLKNHDHEKTPKEVRDKLERYGKNKVDIFDRWRERFEVELI